MVLMAIDHVRVYSGLPAGGPTAGIFFTRWVTHFVAPAFVFLAGTAALLHGRRLANRAALARFLVVRGLWLVLLELTVIRVAWTFNVDFANYMLAGVIWMIGWCMVLLAAAIYLPLPAIGAVGIAIVALHNLADVFACRSGVRRGRSAAAADAALFRRRRPARRERAAAPRAVRDRAVDWRDDVRLRVWPDRRSVGGAPSRDRADALAPRCAWRSSCSVDSMSTAIRVPGTRAGSPASWRSSTRRSIRRRCRSC